MDLNNLRLVEQHFRSNGHVFNKDAKFTINKRSEKDINLRINNKNKDDKCIKVPETYAPDGVNMKLKQST